MRAFRHSKLLKACTAANRFALLTSAYIWPGGHIYCSASAIASKLALLSASTYIRLRFACRIYCCASAIASQVNLHYSRLLRIFGCTLLAAYTVAPRQSKWNRLVAFYLEIYACLTALTAARGLHFSKQVYSASFHLYLTSLHFHLFRNMNVPCGT